MNDNDLKFGHGLNLSDDDLRAIGSVVATWSYAEWWLVMTVEFIANSLDGHQATRRKKRPHKSTEWLDWLLILYPIAFAFRPAHHEAGRFLVARGRELVRERNRVSHWLFTRAQGWMRAENPQQDRAKEGPIDMHYLDELAEDINRWRADLMRLQENIYSVDYCVPHLTRIPPLYSRPALVYSQSPTSSA